MNENNQYQPNFILIPYTLIEIENLRLIDGYVYGLIYLFSTMSSGKCSASNTIIANLLHISITTVQESLQRLEKENCIKRVFANNDEKQGRTEIIPLITYPKITVPAKVGVPANADHININNLSLFNNNKDTEQIVNNKDTKPNNKQLIDKVYEHYKLTINSNVRSLMPIGRDKIRNRLKSFSVEQLIDAMNCFSKSKWWMDNNSSQGIAWFFNSDRRIEQFLNIQPDKKIKPAIIISSNGKN